MLALHAGVTVALQWDAKIVSGVDRWSIWCLRNACDYSSDRRTGEKRTPQALTWLERIREFHYQLFGEPEVLLASALIISAVQIPRRSMHSPGRQRNFKSLQHHKSSFNASFCAVPILL